MSDENGHVTLWEVYRTCQRIETKVNETNATVNDHEARLAVIEAQGAKDPQARAAGVVAAMGTVGVAVWKWLQP